MIPPEKAAEIRRLYYAEHWKVGTICAQLGVHEDTVRRAIGPLGPKPKDSPDRETLLDPYRAFIDETLGDFPRVTATRLFDMILERGYAGSVRTLTRHVARVRPAPKSETFVRVERLPGEQAQVDWGHVGKIPVPGGERALWVFVMVLAYSRAIFAELVLDLTVHSLLRSLVRATEFFGGVTRQWLFDNPKTIVLERQGDHVRYHPELLALTAAMHVQPRLCAVRKPHHKGGVERSIRYLKDRFFAARRIHSLEQGNSQLQTFLETTAMERRHPVVGHQKVRDVLEEERARLLSPPQPMPSVDLIKPIRADKTSSVVFDRNRYSVPPAHHRASLTLVASDVEVRVHSGQELVARHDRCWGVRQTVEDPEHRKEILATKPRAREGRGRERLVEVAPRVDRLLAHWLDDGRNLGSLVARCLKLLELYGDKTFRTAVDRLLDKGSHEYGALAILCEQVRNPKKVILPVEFGDHVQDGVVTGHDLGDYDD
ncbi:MAG: IS21 family transposase [Myxococcales bacterium]|nr:IS21 family transposase [Myxococcales bacterium]